MVNTNQGDSPNKKADGVGLSKTRKVTVKKPQYMKDEEMFAWVKQAAEENELKMMIEEL